MMVEYTKRRFNETGIILILTSIAMVFFACFYYKERIIFTDTAVYAFTVADRGSFYIATNRFICILSQLLPIAGALLGVPLSTILILYSVNFILLPLTACYVVYKPLKSPSTALAILLFYTFSSMWVFYYPVSEFQMGLCLLLVYHAYILWYFRQPVQKKPAFCIISFTVLVTVTFSHPLSLYVFLAWLLWLYITCPKCRSRLLLFSLAVVIISHFIKDSFFKTYVGDIIYDESRKEGLKNFSAALPSYFSSNLAKESMKVFVHEYFTVLIISLLLFFYFIVNRKWIPAFLFPALLLGFWLLVTVSFPEYKYDHYTEHLYQPLPFFVALVFSRYVHKLFPKNLLRGLVLTIIFIISFSKINSNHKFYTLRLQWFQNYIGFMHEKKVRNGVISPHYLAFGKNYDYWASTPESYLLSSLPGPDSTVNLIVDDNVTRSNNAFSSEPERRTKYFHISNEPFQMLDLLADPKTLDSLTDVFSRSSAIR